jgi:hypothetical protein
VADGRTDEEIPAASRARYTFRVRPDLHSWTPKSCVIQLFKYRCSNTVTPVLVHQSFRFELDLEIDRDLNAVRNLAAHVRQVIGDVADGRSER